MKIAVLISGGVDSSVALKLLKDSGHDLTAFYLKIWLEDELSYLSDCPWEEDLAYVREICERENIPLKTLPLQQEYHEKVVNYVLKETANGRTPNPDVLCNQHIKFGAFFDIINNSTEFSRIKFDKIATGHYARIEEKEGKFFLKTAPDPIKDQTYFLCNLNQKQLSKIIFPIGNMKKEQVRALAKKYKLPNQNRKDSQGICFLGKFKFREFLKAHLGEKQGKIIELETNETKGTHNGFWYYTIGQRKDLRLNGGPWYVVGKDTKKNIVYISHDENKIKESKDTFFVENINWIPSFPFKKEFSPLCFIKIRHAEKKFKCQIENIDKNKLRVKLREKDFGIAPGQFAVFYHKNYCLGGGVIAASD